MSMFLQMGQLWNIVMVSTIMKITVTRDIVTDRRMVEEGRDCSEVLIQLSAVKSAINNTGKIILQDHIEHCIVDAVENGDKEAIKELEKAIDRFMK